jgi:1-acyl-sn-glycerol-3-phosphate acyltransferase
VIGNSPRSLASAAPVVPKTANGGRSLALGLANLYRRYHRHEVEGFGRLARAIHTGRPVLLVSNHCLEIVDAMMFAAALDERIGRAVRFIGHETLFFRLPGVRELSRAIGAIPSRDFGLAEQVLREDRLLMLYPGAGTEASLRILRREPYRLKWYGKTGFVRLALRTGATILFVAGVGIDEMYVQTRWPVPAPLFELPLAGSLAAYRGLRVQLGLSGPHVLPGVFPLPVRVRHVISAPIRLDRSADPEDPVAVETAQLEVWARCQRALDEAVSRRDRHADALDRLSRAAVDTVERIAG